MADTKQATPEYVPPNAGKPFIDMTFSEKVSTDKNPLLSLKSLTFIYKGRFGSKGFKALDNLDLEVYEGESP